MAAVFVPGTRVRVCNDWPEARGPAHIRTPHYLRGAQGTVVRALGAFRNPEDLAFARPAPMRALYHVRFEQAVIWADARPPDGAGGDPDDTSGAKPGANRGDDLLVEIFEQWLEPA
jgi:nitrile hydratase subunit beta